MHTYRIVVGVDGSEGGARALAWAVAEAARRGGTVQAVTAWQWADDERAVATGVHPGDAEAKARTMLDEAVAVARAGHPDLPVAAEAVRGPSAEVLTAAAANADLLVLGSHGHGRIFHAVLGSVAEACVRAATCPVVVVPAVHPTPPHGRTVATVSAGT